MRKVYSILIACIALAEFIYIMNTGGFTAARSARFSVPSSTVRPYYSSTKSPAATRSPTARPTSVPTKAQEEPKYNFVAFTKTKVFHIPTCELLDQLTEPNKEYIEGTPEALIMLGYTPCSYCKADSFDVYSVFKVTDSSKSQSVPAFSFPAWAASLSKPTAQPRPTATTVPMHSYVGNASTRVFHYSSCSSAGQIKDANRREYYCTRQEMLAKGYRPCERCAP